jgi:regulator of ribonuclease activity A
MSRSLFLERVRINIEIFCETIGDFLSSTCGGLKRPLMWLAGLALVMTLRSARKGVQRMKSGGLTAGRHEATYKAYTASTRAAATATSGMRGTSPYGTSSTTALSGYGASNTGTGAYGSASGTTYGSTSGVTYGNTGSTYGGSTSTTQGTYGSNSAGAYGSNINGVARGTMSSDQMPRPLSDLIDRHGPSLRVMDARLFHDYGGVHEFYGQVETLQAFEGAGVVEKVLQGPGYNKVLVVDGGGSMNVAIFSKVAAASARQNGWKGVVIHGAIRDAKQVGETPIGCKAMGTNPNRGRATSGSKGSALNIFGMPITTGMWIYADKVSEHAYGSIYGLACQRRRKR